MGETWVQIGTLRVDSGHVVLASAQVAGSSRLADAVTEGVAREVPVGMDLRPLLGVPAVLVPSGLGDGEFPVFVRVVSTGGVQRVAELTVQFE